MNSGSFIINMGSSPQTMNNGLKPYGMVYDLLKNYQVPIKWVINSSKAKDGADFTYNGVQYKGGTFIIPAQYRTTAVNTAISSWVSQGVAGVTTAASINVEVFKTLLFVPNWTLDKANGSIAASFFVNAGIPSSAYGGSSSNWKDPSQLGTCDDIFVLPHADPTWATHQNLYYWNQTYKGNIWAGCHAVSVIESITNPGATIKMNFLSTNGLVLYTNHANGSVPYTYQFPSDPIMQFMSTFDGATTNGSEQIYLPNLAGAWRSGTVLGVYDPTQSDIPSKSPGSAAIAIYGRAYSDTARGFVMYETGHDLDKGSTAERVAAQRAFFNFSFYTTQIKVQIPYIDISPVPDVVRYGDTVNLDYLLPAGYNPVNYSTKWTASCGGTFIPNSTTKATKFVVPTDRSITTCVISVKITDVCGRENFASKMIFLVNGILKTNLGPLNGSISGNTAHLTWHTMAEVNLSRFIIERSTNGSTFVPASVVNATGNSSSKIQYDYTDNIISTQDYFYRIKAVDGLNNEQVSNTVFIPGIGNSFGFKIIPNPFTTASNVHIFSTRDRQVELALIDMTGTQIYTATRKVTIGETRFDLKEFKIFQPGIYILKVKADKETFFEKIAVLSH